VAEIIDPITNSWDVGLIKQTFLPEDADIILRIPIQGHKEDFIAWHVDKKGIFSVKSAYKIAVNSRDRESRAGLTSSSADGENGNFNWKKLSLPLPGKVLHFLWRVTTYTLPLRMKLHHRGIQLDTRCPLCFRFNEDEGHYFLKCKKVKGV
jgi:hypothetical protein